MNRYILPMILLVSLFVVAIPTALAATGDVKINDFNASVTSGTIPLHVNFDSNVSGPVTYYHWKFINEETGEVHYSTENVTAFHIFGKVGTFDVQLFVLGAGGNDTILKTAYITTTNP
jgi:PKD repeat protein